MSAWAIIPIRVSPDSKSRLASILDAEAREALVRAMLDRVVAAASSAQNIAQVALLGTIDGADDRVTRLVDPGGGLNGAVRSALAQADASGVARVVFIHADLPKVTPVELELLAAAPAGEIAIAPDRHGSGTNALSLPLPEARDFAFAFGPDSFARHLAEAQRLGLKVEEIRSPGLAYDVDDPEDLADVGDLLKQNH